MPVPSAGPPCRQFSGLGEVFAVLTAIGLTVLFWPGIWAGGGIVGGDLYSYFLPQKQLLAESWRRGEVPLWHDRTGHGYPLLAESQAGVFYPPNALYVVLDTHRAYHVLQMFHAVMAVWGMWRLARSWGLSITPALLAATLYVYSWLPVRICVEWAAIGAAWLPWLLWFLEKYLVTNRCRWLIALSAGVGVQLLAGHFHLAFVAQLCLTGYVIGRCWWLSDGLAADIDRHRWRTLLLVATALSLGFGLAAVQLLPTWELKQLSQRTDLGIEHDPGFGYIPWRSLAQLWIPEWTDPPGTGDGGPSRTNQVEGHLFLGRVPWLLWMIGLLVASPRERKRLAFWAVPGIFAVIYATGCCVSVARYLPGFGFFDGLGRYGLVTNLAGGMLSGLTSQRLIDEFFVKRQSLTRGFVWLLVFTLTIFDLWWVGQLRAVTVVVRNPPWNSLDKSPIRQFLAEQPMPVRLFSRGANLPNLLGVASTPVYLGLSPAAYYDPHWMLPNPFPFETRPTPEQISWLQRAGVTHILSFEILDERDWPVTLVLSTPDPFLNRAWARSPVQPFFLYELRETRGRWGWDKSLPEQKIEQIVHAPSRKQVKVETPEERMLILTELNWPGWQVKIDGQPAKPELLPGLESQFRVVRVPAGSHLVEWNFQPVSVFRGAIFSVITICLLGGLAHLSFWHPGIWETVLGKPVCLLARETSNEVR